MRNFSRRTSTLPNWTDTKSYETDNAFFATENSEILLKRVIEEIEYEEQSLEECVFMKDEKMLKALELDYENNKVKVDLDKLYPNVDIAETLSNLTGKWIKKITDSEVEFEDGTKINTKDLDYKLIKPLIWWE